MQVDKGEFVFLTGPSGAGKSTFLRLLLRESLPSDGAIMVAGRNLARPDAATGAGVSPQRRVRLSGLQAHSRERPCSKMSRSCPRVLGAPVSTQQRKTFQVLKWVGLQHRMNAYPQELSGGEQQRIAIARALVNDPMLILADEPTGNLDPDLSLDIMNLLREVNARGTTVLVATHDRELIRRVGAARRSRSITARSSTPTSAQRRERMRALKYFFDEAVASLWRGFKTSAHRRPPRSRSRSWCSAAFSFLTSNMERVFTRWQDAAEFSVYLADAVTPEQRAAIEKTLREQRRRRARSRSCRRRRRCGASSRTSARSPRRRATLDANPLPASVEVRLRPERRSCRGRVARASTLAGLAGVADVRYDRQWIQRLMHAVGIVRAGGLCPGRAARVRRGADGRQRRPAGAVRQARRDSHHAARRRADCLHPRSVRRRRAHSGRHRRASWRLSSCGSRFSSCEEPRRCVACRRNRSGVARVSLAADGRLALLVAGMAVGCARADSSPRAARARSHE